MNKQIKHIINILSPYKGIVYFIALLFGTHFFWKLVVDGDLHSQQISIFGKDMTSLFYTLSLFTAKIVHWFICLFPDTNDFMRWDTLLYFQGYKSVEIIWGCTSVKQLYIFIIIIAFYRGSWKKKLWYIPAGCVILWVYNIIRISIICYCIYDHPEKFDFLHDGITRYVFYGLIFLLWVIWEEGFVKRERVNRE